MMGIIGWHISEGRTQGCASFDTLQFPNHFCYLKNSSVTIYKYQLLIQWMFELEKHVMGY